MKTKKLKLTNAREFGVFLVLVIIMIALSIASPVFLKPVNLVNIVRQTVEIGIMAIGMTYLIIAGELDLSVGSLFATCAMFGGFLFKNQIVPASIAFLLVQRPSGNQTGDPFFYRYTGYDENLQKFCVCDRKWPEYQPVPGERNKQLGMEDGCKDQWYSGADLYHADPVCNCPYHTEKDKLWI